MRKKNVYKVEKIFFFSEKLEKESEENKFHKFIWLRGEENNFFWILQGVKLKKSEENRFL